LAPGSELVEEDGEELSSLLPPQPDRARTTRVRRAALRAGGESTPTF
jgi:hypothetical protein